MMACHRIAQKLNFLTVFCISANKQNQFKPPFFFFFFLPSGCCYMGAKIYFNTMVLFKTHREVCLIGLVM